MPHKKIKLAANISYIHNEHTNTEGFFVPKGDRSADRNQNALYDYVQTPGVYGRGGSFLGGGEFPPGDV